MKGKISNRQISAEEGYLQLYADLIGEDKDAIYSSIPDIPEDDVRNKMRNPIGNLRDNIDLCLGIFRGDVNARVVDVISLRYGLDGNGIRTYNEIISELNYDVSYERIRQVMAKGMRMLRHPSRLRIMTYGSDAITNHGHQESIGTTKLMDSVDIHSVDDANQRYEIIYEFVNNVVLKTSFYEFCDNVSLSVRAYNCLKRGVTWDKCIGEMLLPDGGFDIMKVRNCGVSTVNEIKDAVAEWASTYLGKLTCDELLGLLEPFSYKTGELRATEVIHEIQGTRLSEMHIPAEPYDKLTKEYHCNTLYDAVNIFNDDDRFMKLCNDQPLYNTVMMLVGRYCTKAGITVDQLQTMVKEPFDTKNVHQTALNKSTEFPLCVDINTVSDPVERYCILMKFIVVTEVTKLDDTGIPHNVYVSLKKALKIHKGEIPYVYDLLVYNNGIDLASIRGFGKMKTNEVKDAIASWASTMLGDIAYDELVALLKDISGKYITEKIQEGTRAHLNHIIVELKKHDLKPYVESIYGRFCSESRMTHDQVSYFLSTLHCRTFYDLVKISGTIPETTMIRDVDAHTIDNILGKWCRKEGVDKATLINLLREYPISDEMEFLRKIDGSLISQYFNKPDVLDFRLGYTSCRYKGLDIWNVPDVVMYDIICEWLSALTPRAMNLQWGLENGRLFKGGDSTTQLEWAKRETESETDVEILIQIQRIFTEKGFQISLEQATFLWVTYSVKKMRKDWAPQTNDAETWMNIIAYVFTDDMILRSLKRL